MTSEQPATGESERDDIDVLDVLVVLAKHKWFIFRMTLGAAALSVVIALLLTKMYTSRAVIMPPQQDQSASMGLVGQLMGGNISGGGIATALGLKSPNDLYVGLLKSRAIADKLINRFKLQAVYDKDTLVDTRKKLEDRTSISAGKDGLIQIEFEDMDPKRAAEIANAYVEELENLTAQLAISEASRRRLYFEKQVQQTREALTKADLALRAVQEATGLIKPDDQVRPIFDALATLHGRIAAKEIELSAMRTFATEDNPDYVRAQRELIGMKKQLAGRERDNTSGGGDIFVPAGKVPEAGLEYLRKARDVKYYETVYELLAKQHELAKVDEGKNAIVIQLVDKAVPSDKKSKPKRAFIVLLTTFAAFVLSVFWVFLREAADNAARIPVTRAKLERLRDLLRLRSSRSK